MGKKILVPCLDVIIMIAFFSFSIGNMFFHCIFLGKKRLDKFYPQTFIEKKFTKRESKLLKQNNKEEKEILPFVTQYQPSVSTIKEVE